MKLTKTQTAKWEAAKNAAISALGKLEAVRDSIASELRDVYDERSDAWKEGEKGELADSWIQEWENVNVDHSDILSDVDDLKSDSEEG